LDASSKSFGWALYDTSKDHIFASGVIPLRGNDLGEKLTTIYDELRKLYSEFYPDDIVIEDIYLKNVKTIETLSEVRGAARLAVWPEPLHKISTNSMKSGIGLTKAMQDPEVKAKIADLKATLTTSQYKEGMRKIKKQLVMDIVNKQFGLCLTCDDESDACAIAYTYAKTLK